jgi:hypothetical protein
MEETTKHGRVGVAAMRAGMDRKTARKYARIKKLPSELVEPRDWRTREDAFVEDWPEIEAMLKDAPGLEAKSIFTLLSLKYEGRYEEGQLRTLQRRIKWWRAERGPEKNVMLAQQHRPGEAAQTDFTWVTELAVTIAGEAFVHMLCVFVLPYSNWRWATICLSESMAALRHGVQHALFQLGRVPEWHQTDNSTAATHPTPASTVASEGKERRRFNEDYLAMMRHFGMKPRTTGIGEKEQNGDVEAANGALKRALEQVLLLRGSRDFATREDWQSLVDKTMTKANRGRGRRVTEELAAMRELNAVKLPEFTEQKCTVSEWSTIRVDRCAYSVPSRLIREEVNVRIYEDKIQVWFANKVHVACERVRSRNSTKRIDYRHIIWSLVQKPGGFARYVYREEMFPSPFFRRAYDAIVDSQNPKSDLEYLRILHLAASTSEADVEAALSLLLADQQCVSVDNVKSLVAKTAIAIEVPQLAQPEVNLSDYDSLLGEVGT